MKLEIFAVRDRALDAYMRPWFGHTIGQAIRMFQDELNNKESQMFAHPDDYDLYHLGSYEDQNGHLENNIEGPKQIAIGKQLKTQ